MKRTRALLVLSVATTIWYLIGEGVTAGSWVNPMYSYLMNAISDLGVTDWHVDKFLWTADRTIYSPLHDVMNITFITVGIAYFVGVGFLIQKRPGLFTYLTALGLVMLGIFDASNPGYFTPKLVLHWMAGGFAMGGGALNTFFLAKKVGSTSAKVMGTLGIIGGFTTIGVYSLGISAIPQRICVYSTFVGTILMAIYLYKKNRKSITMPSDGPA